MDILRHAMFGNNFICHVFNRYDYLEFTLTRGTKVRYDQKVGSDKWPETVTFKSIDRLQFLFHSDSTTNAWGYKFTVSSFSIIISDSNSGESCSFVISCH